MRREVFRYIEAELRDYPRTRQKFIEAVGDICAPSGQVQGEVAPLPVDHKAAMHWRDQTAGQAQALWRLRHTQAVLRAIERLLEKSPKLEQILSEKYWRSGGVLKWSEVAEAVGLSEDTVRRVRTRAVKEIARELGVMW